MRVTRMMVLGLWLGLALWSRAEAAGPLTEITTLPVGGVAHDVFLQNDLAYVATSAGLTIVDITDPAVPFVRSTISIGRSYGVEVQGNYAYVAHYGALKVVDVSLPDAPRLLASRSIPYSWDVAVKGNVAYVSSIAGELYVYDISVPSNPIRTRVIGLVAWANPGQDAQSLAKLNAHVTNGAAKATGVSIARAPDGSPGDLLFTVDWGYGRLYMYDVSDPSNPVFAGTHYAPYLLKAEADLARDVVYMFSAYGLSSGIYTVPISLLSPNHSTYRGCAQCSYFPTTRLDQGGLVVSDNGKFVAFGGGRANGVFQVIEVDSTGGHPFDLIERAEVPIGPHRVGTAYGMGVQARGQWIFFAAGALGLRVYMFPGLDQ